MPFAKLKWPCPFNMFKDETPGLDTTSIGVRETVKWKEREE